MRLRSACVASSGSSKGWSPRWRRRRGSAAATRAGAPLVAAHPYTVAGTKSAHRTTARFAEEPEWAAEAVHRFELCNRHDFFEWVARAQLPVVANGDFHRPDHLATWKTLI